MCLLRPPLIQPGCKHTTCLNPFWICSSTCLSQKIEDSDDYSIAKHSTFDKEVCGRFEGTDIEIRWGEGRRCASKLMHSSLGCLRVPSLGLLLMLLFSIWCWNNSRLILTHCLVTMNLPLTPSFAAWKCTHTSGTTNDTEEERLAKKRERQILRPQSSSLC